MQSLHLAGCWLQSFTPHFARLAPPLSHLVLSEDTAIEWEHLHALILAVSSTLVSLAIRQSGSIDSDDSLEILPFHRLALPKLKRLALTLDGEMLFTVDQFVNCPNLERLELGSDNPEFLPLLTDRLRNGAFPELQELGMSAIVDGEDWTDLHRVCSSEGRNIQLAPGFSTDLDWNW